jgi:hypothetical protein
MAPKADDMAAQLADMLIASHGTHYIWQWPVTVRGVKTGEKLIVIVLRAQPDWTDRIVTTIDHEMNSLKAVAKPAGHPCPMCGGSGRL